MSIINVDISKNILVLDQNLFDNIDDTTMIKMICLFEAFTSDLWGKQIMEEREDLFPQNIQI